MGKLKSDIERIMRFKLPMVIQHYMFSKDNDWTPEKVKAWIADHKEGASEEEKAEGRR